VALSIVSAAFFMNDENFKKNYFVFLSSSRDCFTKYGAMFDPPVFQVRFFPFSNFPIATLSIHRPDILLPPLRTMHNR
jgi:hypothetical protein